MSDVTTTISATASAALRSPAWRLEWLTPMRCRLILALLLLVGFAGHLIYLHNFPIDLAGDEAQYWDWSRNLDLSYYSKGPLVAYLIRASCAIFGETMPAVRYPALVIGAATSLVTYLLTRKLFGSDRLALGATLLFHIVPMFVAGSVLMTIDPPMFLCWALATYFAVIAIFDRKPWAWALVGVAIGAGFLAKYAAFLWFVGLFGFLLTQTPSAGTPGEGRGGGDARDPTDPHPNPPPEYQGRGLARAALIAPAVATLFTLPVLIWNWRHNWVSLRHVAHQTGASSGAFSIGNVAEMIVGQILAVGPTMSLLMIAAVVYAIRRRASGADPNRRKLLLLVWIGLPFFAINLLASLRAKVQLNWPAPAYFTLTILTAYFLGTRLRHLETWKPWRGWFWATVLIGLIVIPIVHDSQIIYPIFKPIAARSNREMADFDPLGRLRGWRVLGRHVSDQLMTLGFDAFVLCDDYQQTAETAFYVDRQPKTYCAGPYFADPKRLSQYDMWPDRRLDPSSPLVGRDAVYVGKGGTLPKEIAGAFDRVEKLPPVTIQVQDATVRTFKTWRCYGFKGLKRSAELPSY